VLLFLGHDPSEVYRDFAGVPSWRKGLTTGDVFQQDGASCHTEKATRALFSDKSITVLHWPANSPDLNPIENIWAVLKQNVEKKSC
jgi:transposase